MIKLRMLGLGELTLAILKPHVIKQPLALETIKNIILTSKFKIVRYKRTTISNQQAESFYEEHKNKFFYNRLITFMTSGPSDVLILYRNEAIKEWRRLMGPTKVYKAQFEAPDTIRGRFGLSDTRNATHGSDSLESAKREIRIFFPDFNVEKWLIEEEPLFRGDKVQLISSDFVHRVCEGSDSCK